MTRCHTVYMQPSQRRMEDSIVDIDNAEQALVESSSDPLASSAPPTRSTEDLIIHIWEEVKWYGKNIIPIVLVNLVIIVILLVVFKYVVYK